MISNIKPFIKKQLEDLGFNYWDDAFIAENIPSTLIDGSFFILINQGSKKDKMLNQGVLLTIPVDVYFWFKGFKNEADALDKSLEKVDYIVSRLNDTKLQETDEIKGMFFNSFECNPLSDENNLSIVETKISFETIASICFNN